MRRLLLATAMPRSKAESSHSHGRFLSVSAAPHCYIELDKISEPWRTATKLAGMYHPYGQIFFGMRLPLLVQRQQKAAAIGKIHSWQPQRIVLSHGRCFDADTDNVIRRIFGAWPANNERRF